MANKLFLQTILKFSDQIKDGSVRITDIVDDYFRTSGKAPTEEESAILLKEFQDNAPDNVTTLEGVDPRETIMPMGDIKPKLTVDKDKINYPAVEKLLGVKLRGDESFDELLEIEKTVKESKTGFGTSGESQGIGSLFPKGKGAAFEKIDDRDEVAEFIRNMRGAGIKNPDIRGVFKEFGTDIKGGKRAATTLARAADMGADTAKKQELLSELDEMKMDRGPRFFQEEYMGFDDFGAAMDAKKIEVNNAIVDDLEKMGVEDDTVMFIMGRAREINRKPFYTSGEEFVDIIKEELEFQGVDYDVEFYKNYFRELESLLRKPKPRFMYGGAV
jgi:DNA repair exonuclease SbcCD nuclease subunit